MQNRIEGIVLQENTVECLCEALEEVNCNRELLYGLAIGEKQSVERYNLSEYIDELLSSF